jgi:hypothetical protein
MYICVQYYVESISFTHMCTHCRSKKENKTILATKEENKGGLMGL